MKNRLTRRTFVGLLGIGAAQTMMPTWWASSVSAEEAASGLLVRPYLQPGPVTPAGLDAKDVLWLTDARGGDFTVEYGWEGGKPRTSTVHVVDIQIQAPSPEQLRKKPKVNPAGHPHEVVKVTPLDEQAQHYIKHWVTLSALPLSATAWYRVKRGADIISERSFRTRASADHPVTFAAVGDMANGESGQAAVAYQSSLLKPDFFLALGDLCYPLGRVSQYMNHFWGTYANVDRAAEPVGAPLMETTPFYSLLGNHDVDTSLNIFPDCLGIYYFFHAPSNGPGKGHWTTPLGRDKEETAQFLAATANSYPSLGFYSFDEGAAHFTVVDSNGYCPIDNPALLAWIERDLNASKAPWKFLCMHAPMFHSSPAHYTEQKMRLLSPILNKCGVDVVLSAHVHNYQRSRPLRFEPVPRKHGERLVNGTFSIDNEFDGVHKTKPQGTIHIVSGGGGGGLIKDNLKTVEKTLHDTYGDNWAPYTAQHVVDRHSFVTCEVTTQKLLLRAIDQEGKEIDRIVVTKA